MVAPQSTDLQPLRPERIASYLNRVDDLPVAPDTGRTFRYVLTIPVFDEPVDFLEQLLSQVSRREVLSIVTLNVPDDATAAAVERTRQLSAGLRQAENVILIERIDRPIPRRQGVGLARKLAADLACALILRGTVTCPLIFMTDADAVLPDRYFETGSEQALRGTLLFPFRHDAALSASGDGMADTAGLQRAADLYELHLRHYVARISRAGSPYAYQTLGSTIAIHAEVYAGVRGMPRRNAAEDFYLLNKAAKIAPIVSLGAPRIALSARPSTRVPFGTGPALQRMPEDAESFLSYPEQAFDELADLLTGLRTWAHTGSPLTLAEQLDRTLTGLGWVPESFERQHPPGPKRWRAALEWFDGFRTMRFIRERQKHLPPARLLETLRDSLCMPGADAADLLECLRNAEVTRTRGSQSAL